MIKSLRIKNFQSHKDSYIEFDPEVTAFIGLNNHGKSAILKSLRKVIRNAPLGNSFIRNLPTQEKECLIEVVVGNGGIENKVVRRVTTGGENSYDIFLDGEEYSFSKFSKTGIPEEVMRCLNISPPLVLDNNLEIDLNFHMQKDEDFLIRGKGLSSIRTKIISIATGVDIVQKAFGIAKIKESRVEEEISSLKIKKDSLYKELTKYSSLDTILDKIEFVKVKEREIEEKQNKLKVLSQLLDNLIKVVDRAYSIKNVLKNFYLPISDVNDSYNKVLLLKKLKDLRNIEDSLNKLYKILEIIKPIDVDYVKSLLRKKDFLEKQLELMNRINKLSLIRFDVNDLYKGLEKIKNLCDKYRFVKKHKEYLDSYSSKKEIMYEEFLHYQDLLNEELNNLEGIKKNLKVCPLCNRPF